MNARFFANPAEFRKWLEENHQLEAELWVGYFKKHTNIASISWPESVDQALCFGWIDGLRKSIDDKAYKIRFTPRRKNSNWSAVNIRRVAELQKTGLMKPAGLKAFEEKKSATGESYSYEQETIELRDTCENGLKSSPEAWTFFQTLSPSDQKASLWWVVSAKKQETRERRLSILIQSSLKREKVPPLQIGKKK